MGVSDLGVLSARLPIEVTAVDDHTAQRGAVAADELGCGVDNDVGAMLQRTEQIRGAESVVDDNRQTVLLGDLGDGVDVGDVRVGVAERLEIDDRGVVLDAPSTSSRLWASTNVVSTPNWESVCSSRL